MNFIAKQQVILFLGWLLCQVTAGVVEGEFQHVFLIAGLIVLNFYCTRQMKVTRGIRWSGLLLTGLFILLTYLQYFNNVALGYYDGMLYGTVGLNHDYFDISQYFYEARQLTHIVGAPGGWDLWLSGKVPFYGTYGPYNAYNVFNFLLMLLYGDNTISLVLLKMNVSVAAIYLLYGISRRFLRPNWALYPVILYNLYPGYLMGVTNLLRDNIIAALIIALAYVFISSKAPGQKFVTGKVISLLLCSSLLYFRNYAVAILVFATGLYYYFMASQAQRSVMAVGLAVLAIVGGLLHNEIKNVLDELFQEDRPHLWEDSAPGSVRMVLRVLYFMFLGQPGRGEDYYLQSITECLNLSGYMYVHAILLLSLLGLYYLARYTNKGEKTLIMVFGYIMPGLFLLLLTFVFGWPIPRLYDMWLWSTCIIVTRYVEMLSEVQRLISVCSTIAFIAVFYFLQYSPLAGLFRIGAVVQ